MTTRLDAQRPGAPTTPVTTTPDAATVHVLPLILPTSVASDRLRLDQLTPGTGSALTGPTLLLRSPSSLLEAPRSGSRPRGFYALTPTITIMHNSALPFSANDGALWAGRGTNARAIAGVAYLGDRLHVVVAPEWDISENRPFDFVTPRYWYLRPSVPEVRWGNGYANPWYVRPYSADLPWRFGPVSYARLGFGQSGVFVVGGPIEFGATAENEWWGPGIQNAIVMSDNAAGVPRLELRSARPWQTRIGSFEWRWSTGALQESAYFDTTKANDVRSLAAAAVAWRPTFDPNLTLGATRAVYGTAPGYGAAFSRWLDVVVRPGQRLNRAVTDSSLAPGGYAQLLSLFGRWIFPDAGFETYAEWARQELPRSLKDFVVAPTHTHGYTIGVQWRQPVPAARPAFRFQGEITTLEQSASFATRAVPVFYTSRVVPQGYTQAGQPVGAAIGPGASSQWVALDRVSPHGSIGVTFNRIRWDEDVRSTFTWPSYLGFCNHDVSLLPGLRMSHTAVGGALSASVVSGTRINYHFQNASGCQGSAKLDVRNSTLSISYSPFR